MLATVSSHAWQPQVVLLFFSSSLLALIQVRGRTRCSPVSLWVNQMACPRNIFLGTKEDSDVSSSHRRNSEFFPPAPARLSFLSAELERFLGALQDVSRVRIQIGPRECLHSRALTGSPPPTEASLSQNSASSMLNITLWLQAVFMKSSSSVLS